MKKKTSLKDIASKLGVSTALVSYVLNDKKTGRISKEITEKIKKTAVALNYRANHMARSLKTNKTFTIGLIVSDISNPFFGQMARSIEDQAETMKYTVLFGSSDGKADKSWKLINLFMDHQVDGIILASPQDAEEQVNYLLKNKFPFVLLDRYFPEIETNYVALKNYESAYAAVKHMISNKARRIGMISQDVSLFHLRERRRGWQSALKEAKLYDKRLFKAVTHSNTRSEIEQAIDFLLNLDEPIDGLFFSSNLISSYGIKYINKLKIAVPDQLSIVSFDETDAADLFYSALTYVKQPIQKMAEATVAILMETIANPKLKKQILLDGELVVQQSSLKG